MFFGGEESAREGFLDAGDTGEWCYGWEVEVGETHLGGWISFCFSGEIELRVLSHVWAV